MRILFPVEANAVFAELATDQLQKALRERGWRFLYVHWRRWLSADVRLGHRARNGGPVHRRRERNNRLQPMNGDGQSPPQMTTMPANCHR